MDFVKGQLVRSRRDGIKPAPMPFWMWRVKYWPWPMAATARWQTRSAKSRHVAPTATVLGNELLKSDQPISDAIKAYDAEHPF